MCKHGELLCDVQRGARSRGLGKGWEGRDVPATTLLNLRKVELEEVVHPSQQLLSTERVSPRVRQRAAKEQC